MSCMQHRGIARHAMVYRHPGTEDAYLYVMLFGQQAIRMHFGRGDAACFAATRATWQIRRGTPIVAHGAGWADCEHLRLRVLVGVEAISTGEGIADMIINTTPQEQAHGVHPHGRWH